MKKYATFNVSFKLILRKKNKILILTETHGRCLDLPGGRAEKGETKLPIKDLFRREIKEELGKNVKYEVLNPAIQYRRYNKYTKMHALITAYEAKYISGKIKLSSEHSQYEWVDPKKYNLRDKKINNEEERLALEEYFKNFK